MPRCKCREECFCVLVNRDDCVMISGAGLASDPYVVDLVISPDAGNELVCTIDGLFVQSGLYVEDTDCIIIENSTNNEDDLGLWQGPIFMDWVIDPDECNVVECRPGEVIDNVFQGTGLFVPGGPLEYCWCLTDIVAPTPFGTSFDQYAGTLPNPEDSSVPDFLIPPGCWRILMIGEVEIEWDPIQPGGVVEWSWTFTPNFDCAPEGAEYPGYLYPLCWSDAQYATLSRVDAGAVPPGASWRERKTLIYKTTFDVVNMGPDDLSIPINWQVNQLFATDISGAVVTGAWLNAKLGDIPENEDQDPNPCSYCYVYYPKTTTTTTTITTTTTTTTSPIAPPPAPLLYGDVQALAVNHGDFYEIDETTAALTFARSANPQGFKDLANAGDMLRIARNGELSAEFREYCVAPPCPAPSNPNNTYNGPKPGGVVWDGGEWLAIRFSGGPIVSRVYRWNRDASVETGLDQFGLEVAPNDYIETLCLWWEDGHLFCSGRPDSTPAADFRIYELDPVLGTILADNGVPNDGASDVTVRGAAEHPLTHVTYVVYVDPLLNTGSVSDAITLGTMDPNTAVITPIAPTLVGGSPRGITSIAWAAPNLWSLNGEGGLNPGHLYRTENAAFDPDYVNPAWGQLTTIGGGHAMASDRVSLLYHLTDEGDAFESVDVAAGVVTPIVPGGPAPGNSVHAMTDDGAGDFLFATRGPELWHITTAGIRSLRGTMDRQASGLAYLDGSLWAVDTSGSFGVSTAPPQLRTINPATGATLTNIDVFGPGGVSAQNYRFHGMAEMGSILYVVYSKGTGFGAAPRFLGAINRNTGVIYEIKRIDKNPLGPGASLSSAIAFL